MEKTKYPVYKSAGRLTAKTFLTFLAVGLIFIITNIAFFVKSFGAFDAFTGFKYIIFCAIVFILGAGFTALGLFLCYKDAIINVISLVYSQTEFIWRKIASTIAGNASSGIVMKSVNASGYAENLYESKTPSIIKKTVSFILRRIPVATLLTQMKDTVKKGDKEQISEEFYTLMDGYIKENFFETSGIKTLLILYIINIVLQLCMLLFVWKFFA